MCSVMDKCRYEVANVMRVYDNVTVYHNRKFGLPETVHACLYYAIIYTLEVEVWSHWQVITIAHATISFLDLVFLYVYFGCTYILQTVMQRCSQFQRQLEYCNVSLYSIKYSDHNNDYINNNIYMGPVYTRSLKIHSKIMFYTSTVHPYNEIYNILKAPIYR